MTLIRGTLAKIDRRILAEFDHTDGVQLVKVSVCDAVWSTWRRYCNAVGGHDGTGEWWTHRSRTRDRCQQKQG